VQCLGVSHFQPGQITFSQAITLPFFFEAYGIGRSESESTFPIATDLALFASWQGQQNSTSHLVAKQRLVREANTRLASGAERFIFYHQQEGWVAKVSDNPKPYLSRIRW
jgi:hypothetical protein